ncbi:MAG TPA: protein TolR [Coxiellaceae bacterium]|nr:protein TolR [Coxiellaceae bacterium]
MIRKKRKPLAEINVVPYIDVMLVLLVIFMVTTPLMTEGVKVNLPQTHARTIDSKEQQPIIVTVTRDGEFYLNIGKDPKIPLTADALTQTVLYALKTNQNSNERDVYIKGDRAATYEQVVKAMVLLQQAGIEKIGLVTDQVLPSS